VQEEAPIEEVVPVGQDKQGDDPPLEKVPAGQRVITKSTQKHPAGHELKHLLDPAVEKVLIGHGRQLGDPVVE